MEPEGKLQLVLPAHVDGGAHLTYPITASFWDVWDEGFPSGTWPGDEYPHSKRQSAGLSWMDMKVRSG